MKCRPRFHFPPSSFLSFVDISRKLLGRKAKPDKIKKGKTHEIGGEESRKMTNSEGEGRANISIRLEFGGKNVTKRLLLNIYSGAKKTISIQNVLERGSRSCTSCSCFLRWSMRSLISATKQGEGKGDGPESWYSRLKKKRICIYTSNRSPTHTQLNISVGNRAEYFFHGFLN